MMENSRPEEEKIIKDIRNLFRIEKETKTVEGRIEILKIFLSMKKKIIINQ